MRAKGSTLVANKNLSWESKVPPPKLPPPINKALLRDYENPLVSLGGGTLGSHEPSLFWIPKTLPQGDMAGPQKPKKTSERWLRLEAIRVQAFSRKHTYPVCAEWDWNICLY